MADFPFSEWMLSGMVADLTPRSTESRLTKDFCYTTTVTWTPDTNGHCGTLCLTVRFNSRLNGSFFMRNVNASKRSFPYPDDLVQSTIRRFIESKVSDDSHTRLADKREAQEGGSVSRVNIGRLLTTSVTSRHTFMFFKMAGNFLVRHFCKR